MDDLFRQYVQNYGLTGLGKPPKPDAYTPYAAGYKMYGGGRSNPSNGPVDKAGYLARDLMNSARRDAVLRKMKATQQGNMISPDYLNGAQ